MKVTPDRIKARSEQLRTNGFKIRGSMVRAMLEMNAGAQTPANIKSENTAADRRNEEESKLEKAS